MTIYFAANEPDGLSQGNASITTATSPDWFDTAVARCAIGGIQGQSFSKEFSTPIEANSADGWWLHLRSRQTYSAYFNDAWLNLKDSGGNNILHYTPVSSGVFTITLTVGGSTDVSANITHEESVYITWDFHCYTSGGVTYAKIYKAGLLKDTLSVTGTNPGLSQAHFSCNTIPSAAHYMSEFIVANEDTRALRVRTYYPTSDGTYTDGTGGYGNIDETSTDANVITFSGVGDKQSWGVAAVGSGVLGNIKAVCVNGLVTAETGDDLQAFIRIGSTDYNSADLGIADSATPSCAVFNVNPATSAPWGQTDLTALEFGYEVVTP